MLGFATISSIGETGFEPATARPPAGCATRLRHSPWPQPILGDNRRPPHSRPHISPMFLRTYVCASAVSTPPNLRSLRRAEVGGRLRLEATEPGATGQLLPPVPRCL